MTNNLPWLGIFTIGGLFVVALFLFTKANGYPFVFHPDEPSKVRQIVEGEYNFNHPQLTLRAAEVVNFLTTGNRDARRGEDEVPIRYEQRIAENGRLASATFAASAVALLATLAWQVRGPVAGIAAGAGLALMPPLLTVAHFFKEDTAFVFTMALWLVAALWYWQKPGRWTLIAFGLACGLAVGGKWIGLVLTIAGFGLIATRDWRKLPMALGLTVLMVLLVNLSALFQFDNLLAGWRHEATHVATGHEGLILPRGPIYLAALLGLGPVVLVLAGFEFYATIRHNRWPGWWIVPTTALILAVVILLSRVVTPRYLLPTLMLLIVLASLGLARTHELIRLRFGRLPAYGVAALLLLGWLVPFGLTSYGYLSHFANDTRLEARTWIGEHLNDTPIVYDGWSGLRPWNVAPGSSRRVLPLADATIDELAAEGFTHLVIADRDYEQFFLPGVRPTRGYGETMQRVRERYGELLEREPIVVFEPTGPTPTHMSPRIAIYDLGGDD